METSHISIAYTLGGNAVLKIQLSACASGRLEAFEP